MLTCSHMYSSKKYHTFSLKKLIYKYNIREILEDYFSISKNLLYANNQKIVLNCTPNYLNCSSTCNSPHFEPNANRSELFKVWSTFNFGNCVVHLCSFFLSSGSLLNVLIDPFIFSLLFLRFWIVFTITALNSSLLLLFTCSVESDSL